MRDEDAQAFVDFYDEHVWHVYGFFGYRLGSREDAEDLTQLTFERALKAWRRFDDERASGSTWALAIARNLLIDHYRRGGTRRRRERPLELDDVDGSEHAIESPPLGELGISPELDEALSQLRDRDRELVALRFGADLTGPEIARLTGLTLPNVQQILSRSLRRLRAELESAEAGQTTRSPPDRQPSAAQT
jgi:RNA polymerase sigma-70 factor, ECF subfamily